MEGDEGPKSIKRLAEATNSEELLIGQTSVKGKEIEGSNVNRTYYQTPRGHENRSRTGS